MAYLQLVGIYYRLDLLSHFCRGFGGIGDLGTLFRNRSNMLMKTLHKMT